VTPEQNLRGVLVDNVPRDRMIELIAQHLFSASHRGMNGYAFEHSAPRNWYSASFLKTCVR
jgi:hypothetical protein